MRLLGTVSVRAAGPVPAEHRLEMVELVAFLACRPAGVPAAELTVQLWGTELCQPGVAKRVDVLVKSARAWLGTDPRTGLLRLEISNGCVDNRPQYRLQGVLIDVDLFCRLRDRAVTRGRGSLPDLRAAMQLVSGPLLRPAATGRFRWASGQLLRDHQVMVDEVARLVGASPNGCDWPRCTDGQPIDEQLHEQSGANLQRQQDSDFDVSRAAGFDRLTDGSVGGPPYPFTRMPVDSAAAAAPATADPTAASSAGLSTHRADADGEPAAESSLGRAPACCPPETAWFARPVDGRLVPRGLAAHPSPEWVPERCVAVLGAHGGAGATTVALAIADAAAEGVRTVNLFAARTDSGLAAVANSELGVAPGGWLTGRRGRGVTVHRPDHIAGAPLGLPTETTRAHTDLTVVDVGLLDPSHAGSACGLLPALSAAAVVVVVCQATVPGVQQAERVLEWLAAATPAGIIMLAAVGVARWPGAVTGSTGPLLGALRQAGLVVAVPLHRQLQSTGPTSQPLPKPVLTAGRALLRHLDSQDRPASPTPAARRRTARPAGPAPKHRRQP